MQARAFVRRAAVVCALGAIAAMIGCSSPTTIESSQKSRSQSKNLDKVFSTEIGIRQVPVSTYVCDPDTIQGGSYVEVTITLYDRGHSGELINLTYSSKTYLDNPPNTAYVPMGSATSTFHLWTKTVESNQTVTIYAKTNGSTAAPKPDTLTITP